MQSACVTDVLTVKNNNVEAFIREAAEQSTCPDTEMLCCHDLNKKEIETSNSETDYYDQEQESCSSYENEGFR